MGISDRLAKVETNTENILIAIRDIQKDKKEHADKCHAEMEKHWQEIQDNTRFKNIVIKLFWWAISSSGVMALICMIFGVRELVKRGII